jgi:hypothetical protein
VKYRFDNAEDSDFTETTIQAFIEEFAKHEIPYPYRHVEFIAQTPDEEDWVDEVERQQAIAYFAGRKSIKLENLSEEARKQHLKQLSQMAPLMEIITGDRTHRLNNLLNSD